MEAKKVYDSTEVALNILEAVVIMVDTPRLDLQRGRWGVARPRFQWVDGLKKENQSTPPPGDACPLA
jgi:hypothetical protein